MVIASAGNDEMEEWLEALGEACTVPQPETLEVVEIGDLEVHIMYIPVSVHHNLVLRQTQWLLRICSFLTKFLVHSVNSALCCRVCGDFCIYSIHFFHTMFLH